MKIHISMQGMDAIKVVAIAFAITFSAFLVYSKFGILLSDEGFLWYGMMSTSLGEVPIRDFQAYDPARYYWGVLWFKLLASDGPTALRTTFMLVEWVAVTLSLLILRRLTKSWVLLITWGLIIHAWMYVHFKIFDTAVAIMAIYIALLLLEKPGLYRYFGAGVFVGFSAFVGINHGLYNTLSFSLLILFIWFKFDRELLIRKYMVWGSGIVIGYSPMLLMFVFHAGFFGAYLDLVMGLFQGGTNLHLPVPWPWISLFDEKSIIYNLGPFSTGLYFLIFPVFNLGISVFLLSMRSSKLKHEHVLIASTFVGFTYIHYAFDRADMAHMSLAIAPLLIGLFSLSQSQLIRSRPTGAIVHRYLLVLVLFTTGFSAGKYSPWNQANVLIQASRGEWTGYKQHSLRGENLLWPRQAAELIKKVQSLDRRLFGESDAVFVAPMPGLYTVLAKQSPTNHLFFTLSVTTVKQREMIVQIQDAKVKWAIIRPDDAIDGRDDLRFRNAYSLVWKYMTENFEIFEDHELPSGTFLMKRRK